MLQEESAAVVYVLCSMFRTHYIGKSNSRALDNPSAEQIWHSSLIHALGLMSLQGEGGRVGSGGGGELEGEFLPFIYLCAVHAHCKDAPGMMG